MKKLITSIITIFVIGGLYAQSFKTSEERMQWWQDARFGMFIHWNPVSLTGEEISFSRGKETPQEVYDQLYKQFNPVEFDADQIAALAKEAGMKYLVYTTKHHDGFCMWDTKQTDYNIMNSPFKRDVVKELSEACKKTGMAFGAYYSTCDWHHPDFPFEGQSGRIKKEKSDIEAYTTYLKRQVSELILNYGPLTTIWFDKAQGFNSERGKNVHEFVRQLQPDIIINNRAGHLYNGDYVTPEQKLGEFDDSFPWETCMTIIEEEFWSWNPEGHVKSLEKCIHGLVRCAGGNGNFLLNIAPKPNGELDETQVNRLKEVGQWMSKFGYTIYGTRGGPIKSNDWGVSTHKGNKIYLHILNWEGKKPRITIPDFGMEITAYKLATGGELKMKKEDDKYVFEFSEKHLQPLNTIIELEVDGDAGTVEPFEAPSQSLSFGREVTASSMKSEVRRNVKNIVNGNWIGLPWIPANDDKQPWVELELDKVEKISKVKLYEESKAVKAFELQYEKNGEWKTFHKGSTIGKMTEAKTTGIKTQKIRLLITDFSEPVKMFELVVL